MSLRTCLLFSVATGAGLRVSDQRFGSQGVGCVIGEDMVGRSQHSREEKMKMEITKALAKTMSLARDAKNAGHDVTDSDLALLESYGGRVARLLEFPDSDILPSKNSWFSSQFSSLLLETPKASSPHSLAEKRKLHEGIVTSMRLLRRVEEKREKLGLSLDVLKKCDVSFHADESETDFESRILEQSNLLNDLRMGKLNLVAPQASNVDFDDPVFGCFEKNQGVKSWLVALEERLAEWTCPICARSVGDFREEGVTNYQEEVEKMRWRYDWLRFFKLADKVPFEEAYAGEIQRLRDMWRPQFFQFPCNDAHLICKGCHSGLVQMAERTQTAFSRKEQRRIACVTCGSLAGYE